MTSFDYMCNVEVNALHNIEGRMNKYRTPIILLSLAILCTVLTSCGSRQLAIPKTNNYGCVPGGGTEAGKTGASCCSGSNWTGQTLYQKATNYFKDYDYIDQNTTSLPSCCN